MLPLRVLGRPIHPVGLGVSLYTAILAYAILAGVAVGQLLDVWPGQSVGVAGRAT